MKIGKFAEKAGVTVKTLLHYDKIGLLKPSHKNESGYRIYCDEDLLKLQQIATLKFAEFSLSEISDVLCKSKENLEELVSIQKEALQLKKRHIEAVIAAFERAENQINRNGFLDVVKLTDIIKITNMECKVKEQYTTAENLNLRCNLHSYNTNNTDWNNWCFNQMSFPTEARILELGCGTGSLWNKNLHNIPEDLTITLSDISNGMLKNTKENLKNINHKFIYKEIDAQNIPFEDESLDIVIARHMLFFVPDIEKALSEVRRVLIKGGIFYVTTNSNQSMRELNELVKNFDSKLGLHDNGMCHRFDLENGFMTLKKYFSIISTEILEGKIIVNEAEPIVNYKASTIKGTSVLIGEKKQQFIKYVENYLKKNGNLSISTKGCLFKAIK